jgi:hypothetical protein
MRRATIGFLSIVLISCLSSLSCSSLSSPQPPSQEKKEIALFPINKNGKFGYIDRTGKIVIKPQFDVAGGFSEELAKVKIGSKYGYIDTTGKVVINPQFDDAFEFSEELALVKLGTKYGYIDKTGKFVINPKFRTAKDFLEGLAGVRIDAKEGNIDKYGYIDKTGKIVINPQFNDAFRFSEGLALVKIGEKYGYIDKTGKKIIEPQFDQARNFSDGLAMVKLGKDYGYIDKRGNLAIEPQFDNADSFSEGLARIKLGSSYGYIDKGGKIVINPQFDDADSFSDGLAKVKLGDKYGYIDKTGNIVIKPQFDDSNGFSAGLAKVIKPVKLMGIAINDEEYTWNYVDKTGKYIWKSTRIDLPGWLGFNADSSTVKGWGVNQPDKESDSSHNDDGEISPDEQSIWKMIICSPEQDWAKSEWNEIKPGTSFILLSTRGKFEVTSINASRFNNESAVASFRSLQALPEELDLVWLLPQKNADDIVALEVQDKGLENEDKHEWLIDTVTFRLQRRNKYKGWFQVIIGNQQPINIEEIEKDLMLEKGINGPDAPPLDLFKDEVLVPKPLGAFRVKSQGLMVIVLQRPTYSGYIHQLLLVGHGEAKLMMPYFTYYTGTCAL